MSSTPRRFPVCVVKSAAFFQSWSVENAVQFPPEPALAHEPADMVAADHEAPAVDPSRDEQLGKCAAGRLLEISVPLAKAFEGILVLGIEDQGRGGRVVHEKLVHKAVVHLAGEVP